jgi:hypothetical protein
MAAACAMRLPRRHQLHAQPPDDASASYGSALRSLAALL